MYVYIHIYMHIFMYVYYTFRFNQVDTVVREVATLVKTYPTAFIDIPEALQVICVSYIHT